jgi:8-oxo-dGTP diphosphatase
MQTNNENQTTEEIIFDYIKKRLSNMKFASLCIIVNKNNEIFLARRSKDDDFYPDHLSIIGGGTDKGETPMECVIREVKEESNIILDSDKVKFAFSKLSGNNTLVSIYVAEYPEDSKIILSPEHSEYTWKTSPEINELGDDVVKDLYSDIVKAFEKIDS